MPVASPTANRPKHDCRRGATAQTAAFWRRTLRRRLPCYRLGRVEHIGPFCGGDELLARHPAAQPHTDRLGIRQHVAGSGLRGLRLLGQDARHIVVAGREQPSLTTGVLVERRRRGSLAP